MRRQLYEVQRAMRARRELALKRGVIAVLDIGTSKVSCLVLQFVPADLDDPRVGDQVAVTGDEGRHAAIVRRIRKGEVVLVSDGIGTAIELMKTGITGGVSRPPKSASSG